MTVKKTKPTKLTKNGSDGESEVEPALLSKAIGALLKHHAKTNESKQDLLGTEQPIFVQLALSKVPEQTSSRPVRVEIPHPLHRLSTQEGDDMDEDDLEEVEVCLLVKDESKVWVKELIEQLPEHLSQIKKVLTLTSLRKKYTQYKDRRELCKRYDLFLADDRILPMLGKALGKNFFQEKKQPIPIKLTRKEALPFAVRRCLSSTFLFISPGTCVSIKAGFTSMSQGKLEENVKAVIKNASSHIPQKWANIASISVKTGQSVALPVYNKTREELEALAKLANGSMSETNSSNKKRALESEEEDKEIKEKKQNKEKLAAKSPLVKALKKQKISEKEEGSAIKATKKKRNEAVDSEGKSKKKKKRSESLDKKETEPKGKSEKEGSAIKVTKKKRNEAVDSEGMLKKKTKRSQSLDKKEIEPKEKSSFIASKKFKGSKKGYVFKRDGEGTGYYVDHIPKPDLLALDALARANKSTPKKGRSNTKGRRKSSGKKFRR